MPYFLTFLKDLKAIYSGTIIKRWTTTGERGSFEAKKWVVFRGSLGCGD